ncbi:MAG: phosphoribosylanthranilate isomerase [Pseudomonadota bacterium]
MAEPIVKICGLSTRESVDAAIAAGAQWIGLVSFEPSPRHVELEEAKRLADHARGRAKIVSLTVNADDDRLAAIAEHVRPDLLQFHGSETPERIAEVKARFSLPVMKAVGVSELADLEKIDPYIGAADHILLDAKPPKGAVLPGGNGAAFDWAILDHLDKDTSFMLSGGLNPQNVHEAVTKVHPFGVDVSSGVERSPGVKDLRKIADFAKAARAAH